MKTKTIVSIGPASEPMQVLSELIDAGMDIARINFSHATDEEAELRIKIIRDICELKGKTVKIMQDLQGPRIRVGDLGENGRDIREGESVTFYTIGATDPLPTEIAIKDPHLHNDVSKGDRLLLDSGKFSTVITAVDPIRHRITVTFKNGGKLTSNKGINVPGVRLTTASPTEKDKRDIAWAKPFKPEMVAVSFVQDVADIANVRKLLESDQELWSKVEEPIGVANIDSIIEASDGIIVARGDLGVEMPLEEIPFVQKMIVKKCNEYGKPVVVATQMITSMMTNPTPNRADVSDIANAVLDGADGVWMSEESTLGDYPVEALKAMVTIASRAEKSVYGKDEDDNDADSDYDNESAISTGDLMTA